MRVPPPPAPVGMEPATRAKGPVSIGVVVALGLVAALVAAGITYLIVRPDDESAAPPVRSAAAITPNSSVPATSPPTTAVNQALQPALVQIEALLRDSGAGRRTLNDAVLGPFTGCGLSAESAATQMNGVISNRQRILDQASQLAQNADPTVRDLGGLLRQAIQYSLNSNYQYQSWMNDNTGTVCPRRSTTSKVQGDASSGQATSAKEAFIRAYNPVAASNGLKSDWTAQDI
jgi:hypothetical protein